MCALDRFLKETVIEAGNLLQSASKTDKIAKPSLDILISRFIINEITRKYPDHKYISEQDTGTNEIDDTPTWIIDPIDGSENFYRGILSYTISISLVSDGEIQLGTVYEPYVDRLFFGKKGNGATLNGLPIQVSTISDTKKAIVAISRYKTFTHNDICNQQIFQHLMTKLDTRISASTALDMCNVASGVIEGRIMANTRMWDNSAATLLIQEAGGIVTCWDGGSTKLSSDKLVASNGLCHDAIIKLLNDDNYRVDE